MGSDKIVSDQSTPSNRSGHSYSVIGKISRDIEKINVIL